MFTYDIFRKQTNAHLEWACGANTETWARTVASTLSADERATTIVMRTYPDHSTLTLCMYCCGEPSDPDPMLLNASRDVSDALS